MYVEISTQEVENVAAKGEIHVVYKKNSGWKNVQTMQRKDQQGTQLQQREKWQKVWYSFVRKY